MAAITLEDLNNNLESQNDILEKVEKSSTRMSNSLTAFVKNLTAFQGDKLETERETKGDVAGAAAGGGFLGGLMEKLPLAGLLKGLFPIIAGIGGALVASFTEFGNDLARTFASIFVIKKFKAGIDAISKLFSAEGSLGRFFSQFTRSFDEATGRWKDASGKFAKAPGQFVMTIRNIVKGIEAGVDTFKTFLKSNLFTGGFVMIAEEIGKVVKLFTGPIIGATKLIGTGVADNISDVFKFIGKIGSSFKSVVDFIAESGVGKVLGTLGQVLKKIFFPIGLIFTAYDTVKEAIAGYEEGGIGGAIGGAIKGLLKSVVGAPLDLLRSGVAWILEKVGMEGAADYLKSFNVSDIIGRAIDSIPFMFKSAINGILEAVAQALESTVLTRGFAEDVRDLKFEIKKPTAIATGDEVGSAIKSAETITESGGEVIVRKRAAAPEKAVMVADGTGARVTAGSLKEQTDEMNSLNKSTPPVVIQDNSTKVSSGGTTNQGIVMKTEAWDYYDPYMVNP